GLVGTSHHRAVVCPTTQVIIQYSYFNHTPVSRRNYPNTDCAFMPTSVGRNALPSLTSPQASQKAVLSVLPRRTHRVISA
ncbi:MAG TPA: hypothetical protein PKL73_11235, partial [Polyangiaceae bacterium]|nr:hypothetical protein [Polyangiaceae bacterium]